MVNQLAKLKRTLII